MKKLSRGAPGFTLIELLVVIVVIGILAAITLVAYTGLTTKARNAAFLSAFDTYEKTIDIYYGQNNSYPASMDATTGQSTGSPSSAIYACLGTGYTQTSDLAANQCYTAGSTVYGVVNSIVNTAFATVISSSPTIYSGTTYAPDGSTFFRGLAYEGYNAPGMSFAYMFYIIPDNQTCGRGYKTTATLSSGQTVTECTIEWQNGARVM